MTSSQDYAYQPLQGHSERKQALGGRVWTKKELQYLKKWYHKKSSQEIAGVLQRPKMSVRVFASKIGATRRNKPWTQEDDKLLRRHYRTERNVELAKRIGRNPHSVRTRARVLGIARKRSNINWSEAEKTIKKLYGKIDTERISDMLKIPVRSIQHRASIMGIADISKRWTKREDDILRSHYKRGNAETLATRLGRTIYSIQKRANKLGLSRKEKAWSAEDDEMIKNSYGSAADISTIAKQLKRSIHSIYTRAYILGVKRDIKADSAL